MRLTFLGGADEVGASSTLIEMGGKRILVDAGIRISPRTNRGIQNDQLPDLHPISEAGGPDYILVTHAHTDHTGALPLVVEQYPHVPTLGTRPTFTLTKILQNDAQRIMKSKQEEEGELPIFDEVASQRLMDTFQLVEFNQPTRLGDGLQVTYHPAGHIAGAATLVLEGEEGVLVMSGDMSLNDQRAVVSAKLPKVKADALVLESTYGGKLHANRVAEEKRLIETLKQVIERGGKALIPAFALGRAQEVIQIILAFRDQIAAPVYVDGMVRAVCEGYAGFADLLPKHSVKKAGEEHLFFREKVRPVASAAMREQIIRSEEPAVIVASSGMLTGGASVAYAKQMADDARNAIFLTGYQDEEAPGRLLQKLMKERLEGDFTTVKFDGKPTTVRCEIGTYSLSAHADESELVSIAEALKTEEVMLVHGDPSARHSLATALRQRGKRVISPKIGQTEVFKFKKRPWAMGRVKSGNETRPLEASELWKALKGQAGSFFSSRELAQMWWGDAERAEEVVRTLDQSVYFSADWRRKNTFQILTEEQVTRAQRRRAILMANPDIVGKLIVLRDSNNRPRVGIVLNASIDAFEADVHNAKGRHYPADALLWVIGQWKGYGEKKGKKAQLSDLVKAIKPHQDTILPFVRRQQVVLDGKPVNPESLLPEALPEGITKQAALVSVVLSLAADGAVVEQDGLLPKRAIESGPIEQNQAREIAFKTFPAEARLNKVGMEFHRKRLVLTVDFPDTVQKRFSDIVEQVEELTGWDVFIKPGVNQQALSVAVDELMPENAYIVKGPSFYMDKKEVGVDIGNTTPEALEAMERDYLELTGFRLITSKQVDDSMDVDIAQPTGGEKLEINVAYGIIRDALNPFGLLKTSLKQGQIVLTFISPQVGERHRNIIKDLAEETGYAITVHPHPNQQKISQIATALIRGEGWIIRKGPGIHVDRAKVVATLNELPDEGAVEAVMAEFEEQTGYKLVLSG